MRSTGIFDRLLVVLMSLNTFYLDIKTITHKTMILIIIFVVVDRCVSSRPKIPVDCGAWVGIPDIATGGDPPTPPSPLSKAPIFAFFRSLEWQRSPFPRNFVVRGGVPGRGGLLKM